MFKSISSPWPVVCMHACTVNFSEFGRFCRQNGRLDQSCYHEGQWNWLWSFERLSGLEKRVIKSSAKLFRITVKFITEKRKIMAQASHYQNQAKLKGNCQWNIQQLNSNTLEVTEFTVWNRRTHADINKIISSSQIRPLREWLEGSHFWESPC